MLEKIRLDTMPILLEVLKYKPFGWDAVETAAQKTSHPYGLLRLAFKDQLSLVLESLADFLMMLVAEQVVRTDLTSLRIHEKVRLIVEIGFQVLDPYKEALRHLVNQSMIKRYAMVEAKILYNAINQIWYQVGDQSTDYNFYTKRLLLSFAYVPTFRFWLKDTESNEVAMDFFDRKLQKVMIFGKIKRALRKEKR